MKSKFIFAGSVLSLFAAASQAAVPTEVTTAITSAGADAVTVASAVLVAVVGLLAFRFMRREIH
jgi:hypothetical protein